jgi:hypothetical protein
MQMNGSTRRRFGEHLRQVEELLDPIRYDRSIDDTERRRLINEVLATANARALSMRAARRETVEVSPQVFEVPLVAHELETRRWRRELAQVG